MQLDTNHGTNIVQDTKKPRKIKGQQILPYTLMQALHLEQGSNASTQQRPVTFPNVDR